jgi:hypothetical protein
MPATTHARGTKTRPTPKIKPRRLIVEDDKETLAEVGPPKPVFQTFTADIELQEGLSIIRDIGGGKYEIVSLKTVLIRQMGSEEVGRTIRSVPEQLALLDMGKAEWSNAKLKCEQAVRSASKKSAS